MGIIVDMSLDFLGIYFWLYMYRNTQPGTILHKVSYGTLILLIIYICLEIIIKIFKLLNNSRDSSDDNHDKENNTREGSRTGRVGQGTGHGI